MKSTRWTLLLQNQVVGVVLLLMLVVPLLFGASPDQRMGQMTAYGFLGLLLMVVWAFRAQDRITLEKARAFVTSGPNLPILLYVAWTIAGVAFSYDRFYSQLSLIQLAFGVLVYGTVVYQFRHRDQVRALISTLLAVSVVLVVVALAMDHNRRLMNLAGSFHDRQLFGAFLGLTLPVILGIAAGTQRRIYKIIAQVAAVLTAGALALTLCRSAWLGAGVALLVFGTLSALYVWKWKGLAREKHNLVITPVLAVVVLGIFLYFSNALPGVQQRVTTLSSTTAVAKDASVNDRLQLWDVARQVIAANPWMGWGPGTYALVQSNFSDSLRSEGVIRQLGAGLSDNPHNLYLLIGAEQGLIGLALYLAVLFAFFARGLRALPRLDRGLRQYTLIGCLAAVAGVSVDGLANPAWSYPEVSTFFWLVLGIGMCAAGLGQEVRKESESRATDLPVLGIPGFLFRGFRTAAIGCAALWMGAHLLSLNPATAASAGTKGARPLVHENPPDPLYCPEIDHLQLDFLNDGIPPVEAFGIKTGRTRTGTAARFKAYAISATANNEDEFADVTGEGVRRRIRGRRRFIHLRPRRNVTIPASVIANDQDYAAAVARVGNSTGNLAGRFRLRKVAGVHPTHPGEPNKELVFIPSRSLTTRRGWIRVRYECDKDGSAEAFDAYFHLTVPGTIAGTALRPFLDLNPNELEVIPGVIDGVD